MSSGRSYDDEALATAIASSHSWRGVLRTLGLTGGSSEPTLKVDAKRLGLEAGHLGRHAIHLAPYSVHRLERLGPART